ncbi:MAG: helix-turn-helix domain-containing protein [Methylobacteriaceae bacterium]|nr:helix-turn-helix domain-containing protein [Methylobacteriaceae bacterium]
MIASRVSDQRQELGRFVRAHRERLSPAAIGLPAGSRRRTPGLRREEVAQICGLSATWYTWIEQGRDVSVSPTALARLAGALQLSRAERAYLFELAGKRDPEHRGPQDEELPPAAVDCVETIGAPAYILDATWTARSWNAKARRLFPGWLDQPGKPNLLRFIFLEPGARPLICEWETRARRVAAEFRAACSAHLDDPSLREFIGTLKRESPEFARFWDEHGVLGREGGERTFNHPQDGFLRYQQVTFNLAGSADFRLTILVPERRHPASKSRRTK